MKNYIGAIADLSVAIKLDSGFIQAYENRGVAKYYLKDLRGAIADYNKALEINPEDYNTYGRRGWARFYLFEYKEAIADFTRAIDGGWDDAQYFNIRGQAKYILLDYKGAIDDFNSVIRLWGEKEEKSKAFFWRGMVRLDLGQKDSGCLDLSNAAKLGNSKAVEVMEGFCR